MVVTLDADFHALLATKNAPGPSVIRVRLEGIRAEELADRIIAVLASCEAPLRSGAMVTVDDRSVRVKMLPLVR